MVNTHTHTEAHTHTLCTTKHTEQDTHTHAHAHTYAHLYMYVCIIRSYLEMLQSRRRRHPPTTTAAPRSDRMPTDQRLTGAGGSGELQRRSLAEKKEVEEVERGECSLPMSCFVCVPRPRLLLLVLQLPHKCPLGGWALARNGWGRLH